MEKNSIHNFKIAPRTRHSIIEIIIALIGIFTTLFAITMFNRYLLMEFPLIVRMVLLVVMQWTFLVVPVILIKNNKEEFKDYWTLNDNIGRQISVGVILGFLLSLVFTLTPILLGFKDMLGIQSYTKPWQFIYEFIYMIVGVALAEEFIFRGYLFNKLLEVKDSKLFAIILSSIAFGLFHIFHGNIIQLILTTIMGIIFCIFREKITNCTLLSLVIAHGLHNGLIRLLVYLL